MYNKIFVITVSYYSAECITDVVCNQLHPSSNVYGICIVHAFTMGRENNIFIIGNNNYIETGEGMRIRSVYNVFSLLNLSRDTRITYS